MSKRILQNWVGIWAVLLPFWTVAQPAGLVTSARQLDTGKVTATPAPTLKNTPTDEPSGRAAVVTPLFGERAKTPKHIEWEIGFLSECDQNFANRTEASEFFAARGWEYLNEGQLDTAAYRFNLAWLLSTRNPDSYWGLGVVSYQRGQPLEAVRLLKKGVALDDTNAVMMTDLATVELELYRENNDEAVLNEAVSWLEKSVGLSPAYVNTFLRLSWASYARQRYNDAWTYLHKARELDLSAVDLAFLQQLLAKHPDPQGVFK